MAYRLASLFCALASGITAAEFHIDPTAAPGGNGSAAHPWKDLESSWPEIAKTLGKDAVVVHLGAGIHGITKPLVLRTPARHLSMRGVTADGPVIISGGKVVSGWTMGNDGSWAAKWEGPPVREMFLGDRRLARSRYPVSGWSRIDRALPDRRSGFTITGETPPISGDTELLFLHDWSVTRVGVASLADGILRAKGPIGFPAAHFAIDHFEKHPRYCLENSPSFLSEPGTWCHDPATGMLRVKPEEEWTMSGFLPVVPVAEKLVDWAGAPEAMLESIEVTGIEFRHCRWEIPAAGYAEGQATKHEPRGMKIAGSLPYAHWTFVPWAVEISWARGVRFTGCSFRQMGGSGILFGSGCQDCGITDCRIDDVSGNGIGIGEAADRKVERDARKGDWWRVAPHEAASGNRVANCRIERCGAQFHGAVGLWIGLARDTVVTGNEVRDLPYTGISCGWMWNPTPTPCGGNRIEGNHIHHVMRLLSDGGGIYTLGSQPGTVLARNHIHDVPLNAGRAESNGMFLDEGSTGLLITGNAIHGLTKAPLRFHKAGKNTARGNTWAVPPDQPEVRFGNTPVEVILLENNRVVSQSEAAKAGKALKAGPASPAAAP